MKKKMDKEKVMLIATAILIPGGTILALAYLMGKKMKAKETKEETGNNDRSA